MAKKKKVAPKEAPSKSQAIRDQLKKAPKASANEIAEAASKQVGEEVSAGLVYQVKSSGGGAKKKGRKKTVAKRAAAPASNGVNAALIKEAAELLSHAGDAKAAREALDAASAIAKVFEK